MNNSKKDCAGNPSVSIVVPVYKTERYLCQCINSLLHQTLENIEIILVNDGSPDNCPKICDTYAEQDKRIKVIHQQNAGYGKACNSGIALARGEYTGIIESDDYVELDMFERLYTLAKYHDLDVIRSHYCYYNSLANTHERVDLSPIPLNVIFSPLENHSVFYQAPAIWAMIYKTSMIKRENIKFLESSGASFQDTSFAFKIYASAKRFMLVENTFVHYRIDNENSSVNSNDKIFCVCYEYAEIEHFAKEKKIYDTMMHSIPKMKFACYIWNYRRLAAKNAFSFLKVFAKEMRKHIREKSITKNFYSKKEYLKIHMIAFSYLLYHAKQKISWKL